MSEHLTSEELQLTAFTIISHSGIARSKIHEGFRSMREGNFTTLDKLFDEVNEEILKAHKSQTELLQFYANGTKIEMEIIMVHAQDHLMTTMTLREVAIEFSHIYQHNSQLMAALIDQNKGVKNA